MYIKNNFQLSYFVLVGLFLSGCTSLLEQSSFTTNEKVKINELEAAYEDLQEWKRLQPSLIRLIELEQDLNFMLSEVKNTNEADSSAASLVSMNGFDGFSEVALSQNNNNFESIGANPGSQTKDKFSHLLPNNTSKNAPIVLQPAVRPMQIDTSQPATKSIDSKFSETSGSAEINAEDFLLSSAQKIEPVSISRPKRLNDSSDCFEAKGEFAIHLVSYSQSTQIASGWDKLKNTINPITCDRIPLVDQVIVKNKKYFSLRVGPYVNATQAKAICSKVSSEGLYCGVAKYTGSNI